MCVKLSSEDLNLNSSSPFTETYIYFVFCPKILKRVCFFTSKLLKDIFFKQFRNEDNDEKGTFYDILLIK